MFLQAPAALPTPTTHPGLPAVAAQAVHQLWRAGCARLRLVQTLGAQLVFLQAFAELWDLGLAAGAWQMMQVSLLF
jgi:hypothetical protein